MLNAFAVFAFSAEISRLPGHSVSHRLRDTSSVELLLAGVPIERVSILLGHQRVRITVKHYSPWVRSRQEQLEADVRNAWAIDATAENDGDKTGTDSIGKRQAYENTI